MRGVQGAVALRRQRSRREERFRRNTNVSLEPGQVAGLHLEEHKSRNAMFGITLFHIGLVFLFIGFLMVITAMVPGYVKKPKAFDLVGTGTFFVIAGGVMTLINRAISKQEDNQLERYVSDRLSRSKSGCRLVRDEESGLTPEIPRKTRRPSRSPRSSTKVVENKHFSPGRPTGHRPHAASDKEATAKEDSTAASSVAAAEAKDASAAAKKSSQETPVKIHQEKAAVDPLQVKLVMKTTTHTPDRRSSTRPSTSSPAVHHKRHSHSSDSPARELKKKPSVG